jgi:Matrixin
VKRTALVGALGLALFWSAQANAFCLTHGCSDKKQACEYDEHKCLITGPLLHWASSCVSFDLQRSGSPLRGVTYDEAHSAVIDAFTQWLNADCGDGRGPGITISDYGPVECREAEYNQDSPNANIVMFRDGDWPYENAIDTLALTTLIFNADNGEIYDADIEVNTFQSPMSIGNIGDTDIDFSSVITHEIGHFLGLSHSDAQGSTMRPSYAAGQTAMSSIEFDDVEGICTALPPTRETSSTSCDPRHGFSSDCALPTSCAVAPGAPGAFASALFGLLGLSSTLLRRRFRPSARRP